jgi:hypothetical protein
MPDNLIYYSTNCELTKQITEEFLDSKFHVWCSPVYNPETLDKSDIRRKIPVSSNPCKIYQRLKEDTSPGDTHSFLIKGIKNTLANVLGDKFMNDEITAAEYERGTYMIENATFDEFHPLLYLIPSEKVKGKIYEVNVAFIANPTGKEYKIENLLPEEFEIIKY